MQVRATFGSARVGVPVTNTQAQMPSNSEHLNGIYKHLPSPGIEPATAFYVLHTYYALTLYTLDSKTKTINKLPVDLGS